MGGRLPVVLRYFCVEALPHCGLASRDRRLSGDLQ